ncbi:hypothetical protein [Pararhizobium gei]|uniref:hypothetical protein n=1 Tax=Pararhizobium gei TaxID=1395951 RepID=UPI0023D9DBE1|nr:hypothetical protein [Rhizobium gei]
MILYGRGDGSTARRQPEGVRSGARLLLTDTAETTSMTKQESQYTGPLSPMNVPGDGLSVIATINAPATAGTHDSTYKETVERRRMKHDCLSEI